ncbi:hypothetical protein N7530_008804 [Penicillium desertorum]|uniref:FTP domain-containing protein n=1 Tax=Penicillium desertorum TaxID=1303715 RepID=A0A9W9WPS5_9EURO|nr:hypothetical protein N7530_008804 [Penicillium desertorum]
MYFNQDPNVEAIWNYDGRIQSLDHAQQPWSPGAELHEVPGPAGAAHRYLLKVADDYHIPKGVLQGTPTGLSEPTSVSNTSFGLKLAQERPRFKSTAITYQQTLGELPVWDAKVSIIVDEGNRVVNSTSSIDPEGPKLDKFPDVAKYKDLAEDDLRQLLASHIGAGELSFRRNPEQQRQGQQRLVVYHYKKDGRQEMTDGAPPTLILPEVPDTIRDGQYYVAREVLFTLPVSGFGALNWRALIEVETGSIIYLRALTSGLHGWVFSRDPATRLADKAPKTTGDTAELNRLRERVFLPDTVATSPQILKGRYAEIKDIQSPPSLPPATSNGEFDDSVDTDNFAAASAYRHIAKLFRLLVELGFSVRTLFNNTQLPVPVDHRALNNDVNAQAPGNTLGNGSGGFLFGRADPTSQVGIAADFRVAAHEFGHALLWDAVSSPNFGFAHSAGDSLAAIYCDPGSNATDRFNTFPWSVVRRRHDRKVTDGWAWDGPVFRADWPKGYDCEQILSTTLFLLYRTLGGDAIGDYDRQVWASRYTLYLIIGGIATITTQANMPLQYVSAMISADNGTVLGYPGGAARKIIRWSFEKQGLYHPVNGPTPVMTPGPPPAIDTYIDDGRDGEYDYTPSFGNAPGIWNRRAADGGLVNEAPIAGAVNYCYVAIKNRGTGSAQGVQVNVHQSNVPEPRVWPGNFQSAGVYNINTPVLGNRQQTAIAGPFQWTPSQDNSFDRYCLLAAVSANGDLSNVDPMGGLACAVRPTDIDNLVPFDNNLALRHFER